MTSQIRDDGVMESAFGVEHGMILKGINPKNIPALERVAASQKNTPRGMWAKHRLRRHQVGRNLGEKLTSPRPQRGVANLELKGAPMSGRAKGTPRWRNAAPSVSHSKQLELTRHEVGDIKESGNVKRQAESSLSAALHPSTHASTKHFPAGKRSKTVTRWGRAEKPLQKHTAKKATAPTKRAAPKKATRTGPGAAPVRGKKVSASVSSGASAATPTGGPAPTAARRGFKQQPQEKSPGPNHWRYLVPTALGSVGVGAAGGYGIHHAAERKRR